ncbi:MULTISPECIES: aldehyde dehydrogenase [unclassified Nodularia (in: cyanobacteria)]|uniref:aldehyde dehydrogenase n=1 Tax=unclassified Nodularia (in: cyanobacteria) TaxID=2656917 RepID=UPI00187F12BE|nr:MULTISPECIES: aldehyde dehydrogenase [unclassified Nodularia (in: cyanobacteria)]MBE9200878.1 aldehyde dehydrogenase [Nodularia sp. LEGE 06071]MCC2692368.1 aldehyde dehydrogenase [Nodularia sp. LEGE 04288]
MITNELSDVAAIIGKQREFFQTGKTKDITFRLAQLKILKQAIVENKQSIIEALQADLQKPEFETYATEIGVVNEIDDAIKHLKNWTKPKKAAVPWKFFPYSAKIYAEPLGVILIIGPWNYPLQLIISPLIGAIAAGNCTILKPSEIAPHTSSFVAQVIGKYFHPDYIAVVEGGVGTSQKLLAEKFDHIFFTGGTSVGKIVMEAAAKHLTPVTLELGGKSPCIIDNQINLEYTARRIVWGKFINAGQTCIAPDYLLVDQKIKQDLINSMKKCLQEFYGNNPATSPDYARIISQRQFDRLANLIQDGEIIIGGETKPEERYIAPTLLDHVSLTDPVMQEEIFGPILPIIAYTDITEAIALINSQPKPLALYLFTQNKNLQKRVLQETSSGGVCFNDTVMQVGVSSLPFGGVGDSGIGSYHGKASFDTFSHYKSVLKNYFWLDLNWRYAPYKDKLSTLKRIIG